MKYFLTIIGVIAGISLIGLIIWTICLANAFGWKPPSTELELSQSEIKWKHQVQDKYDCTIDFIGLDNSFMEDSVIYMNIEVEDESPLQTLLIDSLENFTRRLSHSFSQRSTGRDDQKCIQYRFDNLFFKDSTERLKYPISKTSMYHFNSRSTIIIN
jgi:hypothetical protein